MDVRRPIPTRCTSRSARSTRPASRWSWRPATTASTRASSRPPATTRSSPSGRSATSTVGPVRKAAADCGGASFGSEGDDRFARYSNHGTDVDLVAPGTCVASTFPTRSGDATQRLTGTSMATPHVTGAVARYLADHPGTDPERMRRLLRAAGRLDWVLDSRSRAGMGPSDDRRPLRLLDVAALLGSPGLRVWLVPRGFVAADADDQAARARGRPAARRLRRRRVARARRPARRRRATRRSRPPHSVSATSAGA